jgi:hypothetical protein
LGESLEIDCDIDLVRADEFGRREITQAAHFEEAVESATDAVLCAAVVFRAKRDPNHLEPAAVVLLDQSRKQVGGRVIVEIRRQIGEADAVVVVARRRQQREWAGKLDCDARPRAQELVLRRGEGEDAVEGQRGDLLSSYPLLQRGERLGKARPVAYAQLGKGEVAPREVGVRRHDEKPFDRRLRLLEALAADEESEKGEPRRRMARREGEASLKVRHRFLFPGKGRENMLAS